MRIQNIARKFARATMICAACMALPLAAQEYPSKPLRLISPFSAGGGADTVARFFGQKLAATLQQQVVVDNRAGAGSIIGTDLAAKAPPDGYTILIVNDTHAINANLFRKLPYDPIRDFAPITMIAATPFLLLVHPSLPVKTAQEFIALAKARPASVLMASAGTGSNTHLTGELFQAITGVKLTHVPYKGTGPAIIDLVGGQTQCMFDQLSTSGPFVLSGKLRGIAVASAKRSPLLASVPTMAESGVRGFETATSTGIYLPAATPRDIVSRLTSALLKVLDQPATRDAFARLGAEVTKSTPDDMHKQLAGDLARWQKVQQMTGLRLD
jgi:tripartite-type tricarboxylate transporter receptor subunit TctC